MDVSVSVRLRLYKASVSINGKLGGIVNQGRNILLFHDIDLLWAHTKVVILLQKSHSAIVGVIRYHDTKWHTEFLA